MCRTYAPGPTTDVASGPILPLHHQAMVLCNHNIPSAGCLSIERILESYKNLTGCAWHMMYNSIINNGQNVSSGQTTIYHQPEHKHTDWLSMEDGSNVDKPCHTMSVSCTRLFRRVGRCNSLIRPTAGRITGNW